MPNKTPIGWTDFSSSPLRYRDSAGRPVWACVHASGGCVNCYAEAALHFVSYEPALGPLRLGDRLLPRFADDDPRHLLPDHCQLDWVICGAESGPKRRPFDPDWARRVRDQCQAVGVPFYFTQGSALAPGQRRELDGRTWDEYPQFANLGAWGASPG